MKKQRDHDFGSLPGKYILLHSGYGGGQYLGRVVEYRQSGNPERTLPVLILDSETKRYQPRGSTAGQDDICYWGNLSRHGFIGEPADASHSIPLKEKDRLYLIGEEPDISWFEISKKPINPQNPRHIKRLTGITRLKLVYEGSKLIIVK